MLFFTGIFKAVHYHFFKGSSVLIFLHVFFLRRLFPRIVVIHCLIWCSVFAGIERALEVSLESTITIFQDFFAVAREV